MITTYLINNSKTSIKSNLETNIIKAAILRKGPKGITLSLLEKRINKATGKAIKVAKKIVIIDIGKPNTKPNKNINFISPPPKDSFLKALSPKTLIKYIARKAPTPL